MIASPAHSMRSPRAGMVILLTLLCWLACSLSQAPTFVHQAVRTATPATVCHCAHCPGGAACCCRNAAAACQGR
ncbi:MAG TPA: hypothetical protein VG820_07775 [Fimbriimonadaceae bacterium]|nr:hypothetical protein [Fimbriimonadaceae bacterium]